MLAVGQQPVIGRVATNSAGRYLASASKKCKPLKRQKKILPQMGHR